jgi:hypothetical protein
MIIISSGSSADDVRMEHTLGIQVTGIVWPTLQLDSLTEKVQERHKRWRSVFQIHFPEGFGDGIVRVDDSEFVACYFLLQVGNDGDMVVDEQQALC